MKTWLFIWNPSRWRDWNVDDEINVISQIGYCLGRWSCGVNKSIQYGDRIFLIRLGVEPRGIVASGYAASSVFESEHWDEDKRKRNIKCKQIYIKWDKICNAEKEGIISYTELLNISSSYHWSSQASGVSIPKDIAQCLEEAWIQI